MAQQPLKWLLATLAVGYVAENGQAERLDRIEQTRHREHTEAVLEELLTTPESLAIRDYLVAHHAELGELMMQTLGTWAGEHQERIFDAAREAGASRGA